MKSITIIGVVLLALVLAGCDMDNPAGSGDGPGGLALTEVAHYAVAIPEPSDLCFDLTGTFLWTVSDNTRKVYSIELNGDVRDTLTYEGTDPEGVTIDPADGSLYIAEEIDRELIQMDTSGTVLGTISPVGIGGEANSGFEGVVYVPENEHFYALLEKNPPMLLEIDREGTVVAHKEITFAADLSGITWDPVLNRLIICSDQDASVTWTDMSGNAIATYAIDVVKAEGLALDRDAGLLYVVSDDQELLYVFQVPPEMLEPYEPGLFVNEFVASNGTGYQDNNGDFDDWIEIYNSSDTAVDIGGMYVSDDLGDRTMWQIPTTEPDSTTIQPGEFLILSADKEPEQGVLHVNIKLSGGGEDIALFAGDDHQNVILDGLSFGAQTTDVSYGRETDGGATWVEFVQPTPGASNNAGK